MRLRRPLLKSEILDAQDNSKSANAAAKYIGVSYKTYKKYAEMYGIHERLLNPKAIGISKSYSLVKGTHALEDILAGKHPNYHSKILKKRLIHAGYLSEICYECGFNEKRLTDGRVPLVLDFIDDNRKNRNLQNLRMLCFNCSFLIKGNLTGKKVKY